MGRYIKLNKDEKTARKLRKRGISLGGIGLYLKKDAEQVRNLLGNAKKKNKPRKKSPPKPPSPAEQEGNLPENAKKENKPCKKFPPKPPTPPVAVG